MTGRDTTGHEWDGIKELNTPLPKWWLYVFFACIVFAFGHDPAVSLDSVRDEAISTACLATRSAPAVDADVAKVVAARDVSMDKIAASVVRPDQSRSGAAGSRVDQRPDHLRRELPALPWSRAVAETRAIRRWRPAPGSGAARSTDIQQTITHGIRSADPDARQSAMPRFGADGILKPAEIEAVADYVWATFCGHPTAGQDVSAGAKIFAENCAACHGDKVRATARWARRGWPATSTCTATTEETIVNQVTSPHQGVMPNWGVRLDPATIKSVTLYVHSLGGGE